MLCDNGRIKEYKTTRYWISIDAYTIFPQFYMWTMSLAGFVYLRIVCCLLFVALHPPPSRSLVMVVFKVFPYCFGSNGIVIQGIVGNNVIGMYNNDRYKWFLVRSNETAYFPYFREVSFIHICHELGLCIFLVGGTKFVCRLNHRFCVFCIVFWQIRALLDTNS